MFKDVKSSSMGTRVQQTSGERRLLSSARPREEGGRKHGRAISSLELEQFSHHLTLELTVNSYQLPHRMPGHELVLLTHQSQGEKGQEKISGCSGSSLGLPQRPPH
ncbi:Nephrin [Manis pentadactyla]|nr:Nephrin [Manis pentadactyla]